MKVGSICKDLILGDIANAKKQLLTEWPFEPSLNEPKRDTIPQWQQVELFLRDNFTCRYCGKHTIFIGTLRAVNALLPNDFPYHPHWKWNDTHPAFWELTASCDHLKPVARGGTNNIDNLVTACYKCNSIKTNWTLEELRWELHEPTNDSWDGLVGIFLQIMEQSKIQEKSLKSWYNLLKK